VLDPYVNAIHVSLLREKQLNPVYAEQLAGWALQPESPRARRKIIGRRAGQIDAAERLLIMADEHTMVWLYHEAGCVNRSRRGGTSIRGYSRLDES